MKSSIYLNKNCPYSTAIIWILSEKTPLHPFKVTQFSDRKEMLDNNILRKYKGPILISHNTIISDFETIILYLNERYPSPALLPDDLEDIIRLRLFIKEVIHNLYNFTDKNILQNNFENMWDSLIKYHEFTGRFTLGDCLVSAITYYGLHINVEFQGSISLLLQYLEQATSRDNRFKKMSNLCNSFNEIMA